MSQDRYMTNAPSGPNSPSNDDPSTMGQERLAKLTRTTKETNIEVELNLDGKVSSNKLETGIPFFDHMLDQLKRHSGFGLSVLCDGDVNVDTHHSIEDVGIAIGECLKIALGPKVGVKRFSNTSVPLDEALIDVAIDLSGRPFLVYNLDPSCGTGTTFLLGDPGFDPQLAEEFWRALSVSAGLTLHINMRYGKNTHHVIEASFKAVARALRECVRIETPGEIPSTKGVI